MLAVDRRHHFSLLMEVLGQEYVKYSVESLGLFSFSNSGY